MTSRTINYLHERFFNVKQSFNLSLNLLQIIQSKENYLVRIEFKLFPFLVAICNMNWTIISWLTINFIIFYSKVSRTPILLCTKIRYFVCFISKTKWIFLTNLYFSILSQDTNCIPELFDTYLWQYNLK